MGTPRLVFPRWPLVRFSLTRSKVVLFVCLLVGLGGIASAAWTAQAATLTVNTLNDADNGSDGVCSLREAIMAANANATHNECTGTSFGDDLILFSVTGTIHLQSTLPDIAAASSAGKLRIAGPGAASLTISGDSNNDGNGDVRVLVVDSGGNLTNLVIRPPKRMHCWQGCSSSRVQRHFKTYDPSSSSISPDP